MTVRRIEEILGIPKTTVDRIMREHLGLRKLSARWVPKLLTPDQRLYGEIYLLTILRYLKPIQRNLLIDLLPWMRLGPITLHQSPSNNPCIGDTPVPLPPRKPRQFHQQGRKIVYHQDNAPSHRSLQAMAAIYDSGFELLPHAPNSPDLAPSDFHLFPDLKNSLSGIHFRPDEEVIDALTSFFESLETSFFLEGIKAFEHRWKKCIDLEGDYGRQTEVHREDLEAMCCDLHFQRLAPGFHRRVKAKTSIQDDDVPIDNMTTKPLFTPQEKGRKDTRDKVPRLQWNPWHNHVRSILVTTIIASCSHTTSIEEIVQVSGIRYLSMALILDTSVRLEFLTASNTGIHVIYIQCVTGTQVSKMIINRRLRELNLRVRRPLRCLSLTPVHRQVRLQWCRERSTWNCADFLLCPDDRRKRVCRRPEQRVDPGLTVEHHTGPQQGVMVWGAISFDSRTPLVVIPGTLTAQRYLDDILRPVLLPFLSHHPGLTFQQDNARPHTARVTMDCLQSCRTLPWPARSPDLSPIEHIWDVMGRRLQPSRNVDYLARQLETIWQEIPQHTIRNLYQSMTRRVAACIQASGDPTTY
ncbi:hypothetical protein LAZ67_14002262 [Cordylochernes scorpioides]|uniref:Transposase n=1 Tax=Cordylochernes scorpioides TaxID=51811 RepID=A0ABY6L7N1_9ARAC|nr:hypothetical protein LAZ67_14002262 [Cordylochernes scorpioides]